MSEQDAREDACRDYQSSLEDLTFNSKPHINMLTILAEENVQFAKDIVILIEAQIAKAPTTEKLPVMYLMDSIVKNVGRDYLAAFAKNIVSTFVNVFEKVDENTRKSLFKLRSTWDDIFPSKKLYALDVRVNAIDPAWPVKPLPPNVNTASIHVNPKFLNKSEETPPAALPVPSAVPSRTASTTEAQKHLSQEQLIRQQLLVKQKQLLELQQKKLELELEQTKAQLVHSACSLPTKFNVAPEIPHLPNKAPHFTSIHPEKNKVPTACQPHDKPHEKSQVPTRDPRLNRGNQHSSHAKDLAHKKETKAGLSIPLDSKSSKPESNEKTHLTSKQEKKSSEKPPKRESVETDIKCKSKSPSPLKGKSPHARDKSLSIENERDPVVRKDPRLHKQVRNKADEKEEEPKERRKSIEKKEEHKSSEHRLSGNRNKVINGVVQKNDTCINSSDKTTAKPGRTGRKRSRSPKSRSPKRRERRSPKRHPRSRSPVPPLLKIGKLRPPVNKPSHVDDFTSSKREERNKRNLKLDPRDNRRQKKTSEERQMDPTTPISIKSNSEPKENLENWQGPKASKRLKTAWEETKILQNDHQGNRTPYQRHRDSWQSNKGVLSPRTPKQQQQHWLSVDANLQIPKELTSASKGELLKKANDRLASGEISQDEFLVVAHQIRQLFQYQEEKHRCNVWDSPTEDNIVGVRKKPLLSNAELTYYQHKAKLKRTQVQHQFASRDVLEPEFLDLQMEEDLLLSGREGEHGGRLAGNVCERTDEFSERQRHSSPIAGTRLHMDDISLEAHRRHEDQRELSKGLREDLTRPSFHERFPHKRPKYDEMEEPLYDENSDSRIGGKDSNQKLPSLKDIRPLLDTPPLLPGARGDSLIKGFEEPSSLSNIREKSPINARVPFDNISGNKVGAQHFEAIHGQSDDAHFEDVLGNSDDRSGFEDIAAPPVKLHGQAVGLQRFEGVPIVNQPIGLQRLEDSQDEPLDPQRFEGTPGQQLGSKRFEDVPGQPVGPQRFEGVQPTGSQRFERGVDQQQFDGSPTPPLLQQRFEGMQCQPMRHEQPMRLDAIPVQPLGPLRCEVNQPALSGNGTGSQPLMNFDAPTRQVDPGFEGPRANRFDGQPSHLQRLDVLPGQSCQKFEGRPGHQTPPRFDGPVQVQPRFDGPLQPRFDGPNRHPRFDGPNQHPRFDGPNQHPRFDGPNQHPRFDGPNQHPRFDGPNQHPRFDGPSRQPLFDGPSRQPLFDGPGRQPLFDGPNQHPRFDGPNQHPRFDGPNQHPRFDGPNQYPRFDGPNRHPRFDGPGQHPRFDGPGQHPRFDGPGQHPRFDGPGQQQHPRFDGPGQQQHPRFDGPGQQQRPRFDGPGQQQRPRFDGPGQQQHPRFDGPGQQQHPRFDGPGQQQQHPRFDGPGQQQQHPRFDGPGQQQQHPRFEGPGQQQQHPRFEGPGQQQQQQHPRFEGPGQQQHPRFEGPGQQQHPRFDLPIGHKGPRFDNVNLPQNAPPYGQTVPYGDQQNLFHGPSQGIPPQGILPQGIPPQGVPSQSMPPQGIPPQGLPSQGMLPQSVPPQGMQPQGMQFQRPEQRFDMSQGPNFPGPPGTGLQCFPNQPPRPPGPYFDDKIPNQQGPQIGNFNNLPSANIQSNQPFSTVGGLGLPASFNQQPPYGAAQGPNAGVFVQNQPGASFPYPENHLGQLDVNELFSKLLSTGILKVSQPETSTTPVPESSTQPAAEEEEEDPADNDVPDLTGFTMEDLKVRYDSIINRLYTGIQCYSCGMRFTKSQTDVYADHLDWHYRQNRTEKDVSRKITHRRWYYSLTDWIEFEEFADLEERAKSQFFERVHEEVILKTQEAAKEKEFQSVPAGPAGADEICEICQEQFEQYWDEEEEEWHLKNAMRVNEKIYHPSCYDDYKNTSSFLDSTPSPSTTLLENPLNVMLSLAKEEVTEASDTVKVKEEPMDNEAKSTCETIPLLTEIKTEPE